jgi:hypothetical protein
MSEPLETGQKKIDLIILKCLAGLIIAVIVFGVSFFLWEGHIDSTEIVQVGAAIVALLATLNAIKVVKRRKN